MTTEAAATEMAAPTRIYRVFIKATPERIWEAITSPEWNHRYGYGTVAEYDLRPGGAFRALASDAMRAHEPSLGEAVVDGEVLEVDPPRRLVQTYRFLWSPELIAEGFTRVVYEIEPDPHFADTCRLTVLHYADGAPIAAAVFAGDAENQGGGFPWILSDLKSLLETGSALSQP